MSSLLQRLLDPRRGPVAVLGYGVSGQGAVALLRRQGAWVNIFDERGGPRIRTEFSERDAASHPVVVYSPGFRVDHPWLEVARAAAAELYGELDFASLFWRGGLIAITGSNGKSTLTEFLVQAFLEAGSAAFAAGNVGFPLSRFHETPEAEHATAVCEISSFQAENLRALRPQALLWTNFSEDHLDRHGTMRNYFAAKWKLVERLRRPRLFVGPSVANWAEQLGYQLPPYAVVVDENSVAGPSGSVFSAAPQSRNYALARAFWIHEGMDLASLDAAASSFQSLPHRLSVVAEIDGIRWWNDSVATNFSATEAALAATPGPIVWIGGGRGKGGDRATFAARIAPQIHAAVLLGETAPAMARALAELGVPAETTADLAQAVRRAWELCPPGASVVFSPGFASFDLFKNYRDRGEQFCRAVLGLKAMEAQPTVFRCVEP